ncbi:uncharacterized protein buc2l isoform X2 [Platichthys flesus]|uniref:uncharacterized protein buc2l isoform X2 n=1 Tax=Platichthys flesus TaxID=8260 RepID=UPI002DB5D115|nr:uncharacterized protein buc2l isoform X2 [Platichthys flesus]
MTLPGPNGGSLYFGANGAVPNSGPPDPGLHSNSQDPGPLFHPQHHVSARPLFYIHPQPPPPFHPYQWPMPFSYNPFAGYPGMGYGMVMPSFPPPPYMDPSAYLLPQPHMQAVDYRRLLHPQVHAPSAPFHNPNQIRRTRPPHTVQHRETMNSEVQTEPTHREPGGSGGGSLVASSDSGHGTTSNSPSSSSSPIKRVCATVENHNLPSSDTEDVQLNEASKIITEKHGSSIPHLTKTVHSCIRETQKGRTDTICQETVSSCRSAHCNMWSVSSSDSMVPICSSSQEENEVAKERRVSIPDILMSWGGRTPQSKVIKMTNKMLPHCNHQVLSQTELEHESPLYLSPTVTQDAPVMTDNTHGDDAVGFLSSKTSEAFFKILKLPKVSDEQEDGHETCLEEDTPEVSHNEMPFNSYRTGRKMNESVWSVESLPLFAPSKEWLLQNGMLEPDVIVEITEETENCEQSTEGDNLIVKAGKMKRHCRIPPMVPELDNEMYAYEMKGQCITPENIPFISMTGLQDKIKSPLNAKDVDENGSSEPEANQSPNQEPLIVNGQKERSPCPPALGAVLLLSSTLRKGISFADHLIVQNGVDIEVEDETCANEEVSRLGNEQLCVPVAKPIMTEVSPSKGHLVDCGIQCTELQEPCSCREVMDDMETKRRHPFKYSDVKMANKGQDERCGGHLQRNQKRHYQRRKKASGGNGRNTRC